MTFQQVLKVLHTTFNIANDFSLILFKKLMVLYLLHL